MLIHILAVLVFFYLLLRFVRPLPVSAGMKAAAGLLLFCVSQQHVALRLWGGGLASPELPTPLLLLGGWLFVSLLFLFCLVLLRDILLLARRLPVRLPGQWAKRRFLPAEQTAESATEEGTPKERRADRRPAESARIALGLKASGSIETGGESGERRWTPGLSARCRNWGGRLARAITRRLAPPYSPSRRQAMQAIAAVVPAAWGVRQAISVPHPRRWEVALPRLPKELDGLTLAHATDLHISPMLREDWAHGLVERINSLRPDLILFTGDLVDGLPARRAAGVAPLRNLRARYGVYGCVGNHEYYADYLGWIRTFPELGLTMLLNSHVALPINGKTLVLAGITDMVAERYGLPMPDCPAALAGAPEDAPRILLAHRPREARAYARSGVDLQLSGHTHGGQIIGLNQIVANFNSGYLYGWYQVRDTTRMYISSGAGLWNGFPARLGMPSEIAHITLRSGEGAVSAG